jgi:hypothetical protein
MNFRCYSCGLKFSDGPPPLEALSPKQAAVVGVGYEGDPGRILCESLKDLSVYNFCAVCVIFARYQEIWGEHPGHELVHAKGQFRNIEAFPKCQCGHPYTPPPEWRHGNSWTWINRAQHLHHANIYLPELSPYWAKIDLTMEV